MGNDDDEERLEEISRLPMMIMPSLVMIMETMMMMLSKETWSYDNPASSLGGSGLEGPRI